MGHPRKRMTVATEAVGDGLGVFDQLQQQAYVLNATSALVWQHCDGQTTPEQLMELLRRSFNISAAQAEQLTWRALDELGKAHLLEAEVIRPLSSNITRRQMLTTFATAGAALAVVPMVALVTGQARAECLPTTPNGVPMTYFLKVREFIEGLIEIPATPIPPHFSNPPRNRTTDAKYLAGIANIYVPGVRAPFGRCSASFLCYKNNHRFYTDISNYLSVDNGLIVSWFTPTTLISLELDNIINGMVTECIVVAATKIGPNPFYGETFNLCVSSDSQQIQFVFTNIPG
jgi:Coenzyme PQQ synthesis protein D (PqqD)